MKENLNASKAQKKPRSAVFTNVGLSVFATIAQGFVNHDFGVGNVIVCFIVVFGLLSLFDLLNKMVKSKMEKKLAKEKARM